MLGRNSMRLAAGLIVGLLALGTGPMLAPMAVGQGESKSDVLTLGEARRDVEFEGGSFAQYIEFVQTVWPEVNIVANDDELSSLQVPPIALRQATVQDALWVAQSALGDQGTRIHRMGPTQESASIEGMLIFVKTARAPSAAVRTHTWSVANLLLRDIDQEQMLTAIKTALELGDGEEVTLRLHPPTGLLIARGTSTQMSTIDEVVDRLQDSAKATAEHAKPAAEEAFRDLEIEGLKIELKEREGRLKQATELIEDLKKERDALKAALLDLERRNARLEAQVRSALEQAQSADERRSLLEETNRQLRRKVEEMTRELPEKDG